MGEKGFHSDGEATGSRTWKVLEFHIGFGIIRVEIEGGKIGNGN